MVDWHDIPKIDAHIHVTPEAVIEANRGYEGKFITNGSADDYIKWMDQYHIHQAFIMPFNDPSMLSMEGTLEAVHNNLLKMAREYEGRFYCFADVDVRRDLCETLSEFDRVFENECFIGIKLHPTNAGYPADGAYYDAIFQYAEKNHILLEIHSYPRASLRDDVCSPARIKNMMAKYPKSNVSIAHLGGFQYDELIGLNAYFNLSAILTDLTDRYGIEKTNRLLRSLGVDRLVFASDYPDNRTLEPNEIYQTYFDILGMMDFSEEEAEKISRGNALCMTGRGKLAES